MDEQEAIHLHLNTILREENGSTITTSYAAALREIRRLTGRNENDGSGPMNPVVLWSPVIVGMALLDQIGRSFRRKDREPTFGGGGITTALELFGGLNLNDSEALYALRNAFAHEFSFVNENATNPARNRQFIVREDGPLVVHPQTQWEAGQPRNARNATRVNVIEFFKLIESVHAELNCLNNAGNLAVPEGIPWLMSRYGFRVGTFT